MENEHKITRQPERRAHAGPVAQQEINRLNAKLVEAQTENKRLEALNERTDAALRHVQGDYLGARGEALREAAKACEAERVDDTGTESDIAYNYAIKHCVAAITELALSAPAKVQGPTAELPPLPAPFGCIDIYEDSGRVRSVESFTADQARGYALDYAMKLGLSRPAAGVQVAPDGITAEEMREVAMSLIGDLTADLADGDGDEAEAYLNGKASGIGNLHAELLKLLKTRPAAPALSERAPRSTEKDCPACEGKGGWVTAEWTDPVSGPESEGERCGDCEGTGKVLAAPHADDLAVDRFAAAMKEKMAKQHAKGYGGWESPLLCHDQFLADELMAHTKKGDPVDVANFAMMLHQRNQEHIEIAVLTLRGASIDFAKRVGAACLPELREVEAPSAGSVADDPEFSALLEGILQDTDLGYDKRERVTETLVAAIDRNIDSLLSAARKAAPGTPLKLEDAKFIAEAAKAGVFCTMPQAVALGRAIEQVIAGQSGKDGEQG
jgi:hypothetical protein